MIEEFKYAYIKVTYLLMEITGSHDYFQIKLQVIKALFCGFKVSL